MNLAATLLRGEAPRPADSKDPQHARFGQQQTWRVKSKGEGRGGSGRIEERIPVQQSHTSLIPTSSRLLAQVGECFPPTPAARSTDSDKMSSSDKNTPLHNPPRDTEHPGDFRKLIATIPAELLATLRTNCASKASVSLLGRIQGKHPGLKTLTAWARETLHPTLTLLSLKANNVFEVTFGSPEGRTHALNQADPTCEAASIFFSSWRPHFDAKKPQDTDSLDHPVWVQIVDLCQVLRTDEFLQTIGEQIGQVISIDSSDAYKAKLFGPRIRLLVRDLQNLPQVVVVPRLDGEGTVEYTLEYSGLPHQCGRYRSHDHPVKYCPRKEYLRKREPRPNITQQQPCSVPTVTEPTDKSGNEETIEHAPNPPTVAIETPDPIVQATQATTAETSPLPALHLSPAKLPETPTTPEGPAHMLETDADLHFPKLPSRKTDQQADSHTSPPTSLAPTHFVWRSKPLSLQQEAIISGREDKGKTIVKPPDSTPITRQGYRLGRLAEDFWTTMNPPNTPQTTRKTLQVIPFLLKDINGEAAEYLVDNKNTPHQPIAHVHIAELLAGIPWTEARTRQHVVNEVAQALHKVLIFTNKNPNPLQKWKQGCWFAHWEEDSDCEHTCTLYVGVQVQENKIKIQKGHNFGWCKVPPQIWARITAHNLDTIQDCEADRSSWQQMMGMPRHRFAKPTTSTGSSQNRFSVLSEEEILTQ